MLQDSKCAVKMIYWQQSHAELLCWICFRGEKHWDQCGSTAQRHSCWVFFPQTVQQQKFQSISLSWSNQLLTETDNNIFVEVPTLFRQRMIYNLELYLKYSVRLPIRLMKHHQDEVVEGEWTGRDREVAATPSVWPAAGRVRLQCGERTYMCWHQRGSSRGCFY